MSRIGKKPIPLPVGVDVKQDESGLITIKGPRGQLSWTVPTSITVALSDGVIDVTRDGDDGDTRALHGLTRSLVANMITGVTTGFTKTLEISGVGYRAQKNGNNLTLAVGYSHPVEIQPLEGIEFTVETPTRVLVSGIDKQVVGEMAAQIRQVRKPEPYKGKGIRYSDEVIRRKAGKAGKAG